MKKEEVLMKQLTDMAKLTEKGQLQWKVSVSTTEYNPLEKKPTIEEEGVKWTVDECYVSYECQYKGQEFVLITYEMIHTNGNNKKSNNLVFLPPLGVRFFDLRTLLPYSVEASNILTYEIHQIWLMIINKAKANDPSITLDINERELTIE